MANDGAGATPADYHARHTLPLENLPMTDIPSRPWFSAARPLAAAVLLAAGLGACLSTPGPSVAGDGRCDASQLQWAVGEPGNEANMRKLASQSGAGLVNPVGPATVITRDHRDDRLRVYLDAGNTITAVRCE